MHDDPALVSGPRIDPGTFSPSGKLVRFHGGKPKAPKPSAQESLLSARTDKMLGDMFKSSMKPIPVPEVAPPPPAPVPSPPPTMSNADVMAARKQAKKEAAQRKGMKSTILSSYTNDLAKSVASLNPTLLG